MQRRVEKRRFSQKSQIAIEINSPPEHIFLTRLQENIHCINSLCMHNIISHAYRHHSYHEEQVL